MRKGTFQWMKSVNKSIILNKIRTDAPISRAQIAKEAKLTPPTVSSNVKELIDQGIVIESELGESLGGRKPTMLLINHKAFYIVGVDVGPKMITCILSDLFGHIIERVEIHLTTPITNELFMDLLKQGIRQILGNVPGEMDKVIGIGVAMHGVVEVETGTSLFAPNLGLTNVPIKDELEREFEVDVKVENDARAMALGESWFGDHGELDSMLAVNLGRGVGAGLVINGELYHGAKDIAGEVGHMMIDLHGDLCECGNYGCLQTFAAGPGIARRANAVRGDQAEQILSGKKVYEMAVAGDEGCIEALKQTGKMIGIGLTNLIHIINPEKIVLGGSVTKSEQFILPEIRKTITHYALTPEAKKTKVVVTTLGDDATIIGAVSLLLVDLFAPN